MILKGQNDSLTMTAGTYSFPDRGSPFDERNPEAVKSMMTEELRRQAAIEQARRKGQAAEGRRDSLNSDQRGAP